MALKAGTRARRPAQLAALAALLLSPAIAAPLDDVLAAADRGQCIEDVAYRMIQQRGPANAVEVVRVAVEALQQRGEQQRSLGCQGDIAAQAIAAGADPDQVLQATAAGL